MDRTRREQAILVGAFVNYNEAAQAVAELKDGGFDSHDGHISLVGKDKDQGVGSADRQAGVGAATGSAVGSDTPALASLGMTFGVVPALGPILVVGPLAAMLFSASGEAAAGGLIGGLLGMGLSEEEACYYESEVKAGRFLVTLTDESASRHQEAWAILRRLGASAKAAV